DAQPGREAVRLRPFEHRREAGRHRRKAKRTPLDVRRGNREQQQRDEQQDGVGSNAHGITPASSATFENLLQDERLVVLFVPRTVEQGNGVRLAFMPQQLERILLPTELLPVPGLKLFPFTGSVAEPLAQL